VHCNLRKNLAAFSTDIVGKGNLDDFASFDQDPQQDLSRGDQTAHDFSPKRQMM
jgi:hypothetical protein